MQGMASRMAGAGAGGAAGVVRGRGACRTELREEERLRRLAEMERDAAAHDALRYSRVAAARSDGDGKGEDRAGPGGVGEEARFVSRMNRETVMAGAGGSLEARIAQRRHYHQRGLADDA